MDLALARTSAALGQWRIAPFDDPAHVLHVLLEDATCPFAVERRAVPGDDGGGPSRRGPRAASACQRRHPASLASRSSGSRPATGNRRTRAPPATEARRSSRPRCARRLDAVRARRRHRRSTACPGPGAPGSRRARAAGDPRRSAPRRTLAARAAPRRARPPAARAVGSPAPSVASGNASRPSRWSQSPWVTSRPLTGKPACSISDGSASSSSGRTGESIRNPSSLARIAVQVVCQMALTTTITSGSTASALITGGGRARLTSRR